MERPGGIEFQGLLNELRQDLENYFAALNEKKIAPRSKVSLVQPELYLAYKACKKMNMPLVNGGYLDQPYEWNEICGAIEAMTDKWRALGAPI